MVQITQNSLEVKWVMEVGGGRNLRIYMPLKAKIVVSIKIAISRKNDTFRV